MSSESTKPMNTLLNEPGAGFVATPNIPKKLAPMLNITQDFPLIAVHLDPLVALKIVKHAREQMPQPVNGQLLGLQVSEVLEITQSYAVPTQTSDEESANYQVDMLQLLKDVNSDTDSVGWYQSTMLSNFLQQPFLDTQQGYHNSLKSKCVALVLDVVNSERGNLDFKAYRLSDTYLKLVQDDVYTTKKMAELNLSYADVLEELPVYIKNGSYANVLMHELETTTSEADLTLALQRPSSFDSRLRAKQLIELETEDSESTTDISGLFPISTPFLSVPNPNTLSLPNIVETLAKPLEMMADVIDETIQNSNQWMYWQRGAAKELRRAQTYVADIKQKNTERMANGEKLVPVPSEKEVAEKFRILPEPSRLDSLLINAQLHELCQQVRKISGPSVTKLFAIKALESANSPSTSVSSNPAI